MTIAAGKTPYHSYFPGSAMSPEAIPFEYLDVAEINVSVVGGAALVEGVDYQLGGDGRTGTGTITALVDAGSAEWGLWTETADQQQIDLAESRKVPLAQYERELDRQAIRNRENRFEVGRALKVDRGKVPPEVGDIADGQVLALVDGKLKGVTNDPAAAADSAEKAEEAEDGAVDARDLARLYAISDTDAAIPGAESGADRGAKYFAELADADRVTVAADKVATAGFKDLSELAALAALAGSNGGPYDDVATGRAAVADGEFYWVRNGDGMELYQRVDAGTSTDKDFTLASLSAIAGLTELVLVNTAGTANALVLTPKPGASSGSPYVYKGRASFDNTSTVTVDVTDLTAGDVRQLRLPDGLTQVPPGLIRQDQEFVIQYSTTTGLFTLISPNAAFLNDVPLTQSNSDPAAFQCKPPDGSVIIGSGVRSTFTITAPSDRGSDANGMTLEIVGVNDGDARQVVHPDGSQIADNLWVTGDKLVVAPLQADGKFRLLYPPKPAAQSADTYGQFYAARNAVQRVHAAFEG